MKREDTYFFSLYFYVLWASLNSTKKFLNDSQTFLFLTTLSFCPLLLLFFFYINSLAILTPFFNLDPIFETGITISCPHCLGENLGIVEHEAIVIWHGGLLKKRM